MPSEPIVVLLRLVEILDRLGIPYVVGGSVASSLRGEPRGSVDADIVAPIESKHVEDLVRALTPDWYVSEAAMREAIAGRRSFNIILHKPPFKVDVFIPSDRLLDRSQLERRAPVVVARDPERVLYVATAEDILLQKLEWFRKGNEVSDRQWRDILGILKVRGRELDFVYVSKTAAASGLSILLDRALREAGLGTA